MEELRHECGVALVRLLKPLSYYKEKYGDEAYGLNKLYPAKPAQAIKIHFLRHLSPHGVNLSPFCLGVLRIMCIFAEKF